MPRLPQNIWVAAADADLPRVQQLVELDAIDPNQPDDNSYTPMHAAASYSQLHVLRYLISKGGDVNITDADGDTPLYTVEDIETARFLVEHGAVIDRHNNDGISPIEHLQEEFPDVARYLQSLTATSERLTTQLLGSVQDIMQRAEADGRDPDDELRDVVSRTVLDGVARGHDTTAGQSSQPKRQRLEEGNS